MATTFVDYTGDGNATKSFSFPSIQQSDIKVEVDNVLKTVTTHYNITSYTTTGGGNVVFTSGNIPASPAKIRIFRDTNVDSAKATYTAGSSIKAADLNANHEQVLFAVQEEQNVVNATTTVDGFMSAADKTKLDGIETAATADQTASEIRTLVESASDSNVFTDADHSKLDGVEAGATADQSDEEIQDIVGAMLSGNTESGITVTYQDADGTIDFAVASQTDENFTTADHSKLDGIEAGATTDQTASEIRALVESASDSNVFTDADHSKLNAIEASADVTDATNVDAAGAVMNSDLDTKGEILVGDGSGDPTALSVGQNGYILTADSNEATGVKWAVNAGGGGGSGAIGNVVEDTTPQLGGNLDVQANQINTSTTNGNVKLNPNGTGCVEIMGDGSTSGTTGAIQLNCSNNNHGVKIQSPAHSAGATYTLTLPVNDGNNNQVLKTDGNGVLAWVDQTTDTNTQLSNAEVRTAVEAASDSNVFTDADHTKLNGIAASANNYVHPNHSGEVTSTADGATVIADDIVDEANLKVSNSPTDGYFLSAQSGNTGGLTWAAVDLTALSASNLTSGTIPDARFPSTLPALDGSNLTGLASTTAGGAIYENSQTISATHTIPSGSNGMSAGPVTVNNGVTLTISSGSTYTIV